ncbi:hypothetical protein PR048_023205 [Dryococelus australis]|uniref:Uncharacterized protein n=1 Tax=Dryococelus australis TaxID=614101 RepID=A0ABQ9GTH6_9NEOP|nr:hypothetical protein PR048_023205 [Dryococelus australis]
MDTIKHRRSREVTEGLSNQETNTDEEYEVAVEMSTKFSRGASFDYKLRLRKGEDMFEEIPVCRDAFMNIHGISRGRLRHIQSSLVSSGMSPLERRGKHVSRSNQTPTQIVSLVEAHIRSFKPRQHSTQALFLEPGIFSDLRKLYSVLKPSSFVFYSSLGDPVSDTADFESDVELYMSDNSSGGED